MNETYTEQYSAMMNNAPYSEFTERIQRMPQHERETLKTASGRLGDATPQAVQVFMQMLPSEVPDEHLGRWFAVASWMAADHREGQPLPLATIYQQMAENVPGGRERIQRQVTTVLDSCTGPWDDLMINQFQRLVRGAVQGGYSVDYARLLCDIDNWEEAQQDRIIDRVWLTELAGKPSHILAWENY